MLMAADVSYMLRTMNRYTQEEKEDSKAVQEERRDLVTRDLLGRAGAPVGSFDPDSDPDLKVSSPWEKQLDLVTGEVHRRRGGGLDLDFLPHEPPSVELRLFPMSSASAMIPPADYQSVCTLDKVKSALDRIKNRVETSSIASSSTTTASTKRRMEEDDGEDETKSSVEVEEPAGTGAMLAAGCPSCLSYVLVSDRDSRCPRCGTEVTAAPKKRRLDLNDDFSGNSRNSS